MQGIKTPRRRRGDLSTPRPAVRRCRAGSSSRPPPPPPTPPPGSIAPRNHVLMEIHGARTGCTTVCSDYQLTNFAANGLWCSITKPREAHGYGSPFGNADRARVSTASTYGRLDGGVAHVRGPRLIDTSGCTSAGCSGGACYRMGHRPTRPGSSARRCVCSSSMDEHGGDRRSAVYYGFFDAPFWEREQWIAVVHSLLSAT